MTILWVAFLLFLRSSKHASFVEMSRIDYLLRNHRRDLRGVLRLSRTGIRVSGLNHEVAYNTVDKYMFQRIYPLLARFMQVRFVR